MKKKIYINCDKTPKIPHTNWSIESHKKQGKILWEPEKISFYLSDKQKTDRIIGNDLQKGLEDKPVLNANVLDFLLENPHLIPESWKQDEQDRTRYIFFWGTIFRGSDEYLVVRDLCWGGGGWFSGCGWLDYGFDGQSPAAVCASSKTSEPKNSSDPSSLELRVKELERIQEKILRVINI